MANRWGKIGNSDRFFFFSWAPKSLRMVIAAMKLIIMFGCESWTINKTEHQRIDAFELWSWRRFLRVPLTARRSGQSVLKEINPKYSVEGLMLKLKLQYFGHPMGIADSLEKTLTLGKIEGKRRRGWQTMRWLDSMLKSTDITLPTKVCLVKAMVFLWSSSHVRI